MSDNNFELDITLNSKDGSACFNRQFKTFKKCLEWAERLVLDPNMKIESDIIDFEVTISFTDRG